MTLTQIFVLAFLQGITEFLPVSSSAHLIFPSQILGWPDQGLAFDVAVHIGTLLAVIIYYFADLVKITFAVKEIGTGHFSDVEKAYKKQCRACEKKSVKTVFYDYIFTYPAL